ncbi:hypothetical protein HDU93_000399, partial [Gonapodya sp. JEL0774]
MNTAKLADLHSLASSLRSQLDETRAERDAFERRLLEAVESAEIAGVDKEMAEEKAATLEVEVEELQEAVQELKVEVEVLRQNADPTGESEQRAVQMVQLQKQNERLKEALVKLRDVTAEQEAEHKVKVLNKEKEMSVLKDYKEKYEALKPQYDGAQRAVEELKLRLDEALSAEEMVMHLTEKNLTMGEKIDEMRMAIEDLEALKELNDELEEGHVETEQQLQAEIDMKDAILREQSSRLEKASETLGDYERTIQQFRELVRNLQADIDSLRESQTRSSDDDLGQLASQSHEMLRLNIQLQNTATDVRTKQVELDLRKLEANQAMEQVELMKPYLPTVFFKDENESIQCLLLFRRLAFKADLLGQYLEDESTKQRAQGFADLESCARAVYLGEMRHKLAIVHNGSMMFAAFIENCSVDEFIAVGAVHSELIGSERRIDGLVSLLKSNVLKGDQSLGDAGRTAMHIQRLAEVHLTTKTSEWPVCRKWKLLSDTISVELAADRLDSEIRKLRATFKTADNVGPDVAAVYHKLEVAFLEPLDAQYEKDIGTLRVLARKLQRTLRENEHKTWPLTVVKQITEAHDACIPTFEAAIKVSRAISEDLMEAFQMADIVELPVLTQIASEHLGEDSWQSTVRSARLLVENLNAVIQAVSAEESWELIESVTPPWVTRGEMVKEGFLVNVETQRAYEELTEHVAVLHTELQ